MSEFEKGIRWWVRYVFVPLLGSGGIAALIIALIFKMDSPRSADVVKAIESHKISEPFASVGESDEHQQSVTEALDFLDISSLHIESTSDNLVELVKGCTHGAASSCNQLGLTFYTNRPNLEINNKKAAKLFEKSCEYGGAEGCANFARMLLYGAGIERDIAKARRLSEKACSQISPNGCNVLGVIYYDGVETPKDNKKAKALFTQSCAGQFAKGCFNLGRIHNSGAGVKVDFKLAAKYFGRACDGDFAQGCYQLGNLFGWGRGVEKDKAEQLMLYKKSCDLGYGTGCRLSAMELESDDGAAEEILELFKKGCENGDGESCTRFVSTSVEDTNEHAEPDFSVCEPGDKSCQIVAIYSWISNRNKTPYIVIDATGQDLGVPERYIEESGQIIINISRTATRNLFIDHDSVQFKTNFASIAIDLDVPLTSIKAIYGKEDGRGIVF